MKIKQLNKLIVLIVLFAFFLLYPISVKATYANLGASGGTVTSGENVTVSLRLNGVDDGNKLQAVGGYINFDTNYLEMISCSGSLNYQSGNRKFAYMDMTGVGMTSGNIGTCTFRTKAVGNTSVNFQITSAAIATGDISASSPSAYITIKTPPSSNNNLSRLSVSPGGINFNGGTNYSMSVGANITSVTVSAAAEDPKSSISGQGTHNIGYGSNTINVVVTAENGARKVYTINVNRKDDRSSNNNLSSLNISNGKLEPGFSKGNTRYNMEVPYSVSKLSINAQPEDSKAKVSINNPDLIAEETTQVSVTVTAENGSTKTYVINVKRGKDPNKKLSNNNYLNNLSVSVGMLSPSFNKEKMNYAVYLPYEISEINIDVSVEDTKYATIEKQENKTLVVGNNLFKYTVTAENGEKRVYSVTVVRNKSLEDIDESLNNNVYLKKLSVKNGILMGSFNKKKGVYYYYKLSKKFDIKEAIPEIKDNNVSINKLDGAYVVVVESPSGVRGYYLLIEKKIISWKLLIIVLVCIGLFIYIYSKKKGKKSDDSLNKKEKKDKKKKLKEKSQKTSDNKLTKS